MDTKQRKGSLSREKSIKQPNYGWMDYHHCEKVQESMIHHFGQNDSNTTKA
jgi:hypothetical protein